LQARLLAWWDAGHRALPWRYPQGEADPYRVWLAEAMLQQTQVSVVIPYYRRFLSRFPSIEALAQASEEEVLALWSGLGYYARGRHLRAAAREALARYGRLPASREALCRLPGFGPYTAGAVASIAFALQVPCVDGNAARVLSRLFLVEGALGEAKTRRELWSLAGSLVPADRPGDFNQALMELGATVCGRHAPRCRRCPLAPGCAARRAGRQAAIPVSRPRQKPVRLEMACAVVEGRDGLLLARRPFGGLFGGMWELPSAVVPAGEDGRTVLRRALRERLSLRVVPGPVLASLCRVLTHRRLHLVAYRCQARLPAWREHLLFVPRGSTKSLALPRAMQALIDELHRLGSPA